MRKIIGTIVDELGFRLVKKDKYRVLHDYDPPEFESTLNARANL